GFATRPLPEVTVKLTTAPDTALLNASVSFTAGATATAVPTCADSLSPAWTVIATGAPAWAVAMKVSGAKLPPPSVAVPESPPGLGPAGRGRRGPPAEVAGARPPRPPPPPADRNRPDPARNARGGGTREPHPERLRQRRSDGPRLRVAAALEEERRHLSHGHIHRRENAVVRGRRCLERRGSGGHGSDSPVRVHRGNGRRGRRPDNT